MVTFTNLKVLIKMLKEYGEYMKIGAKVKHKFRDYSGKIIAIENDLIYVLFDQTDYVDDFTAYQFKKLMVLQ